MALKVIRRLFLTDDLLTQRVAEYTLESRETPSERRAACIDMLAYWEGPSTAVWADEKHVYTQAGRLCVSWDVLKRASRVTERTLRSALPAGTRVTLTVSAPAAFAKCQAALLCAAGCDFAAAYTYSCTRHPQKDQGMVDLAYEMFLHVQRLIAPPRDLLALSKGRPACEQSVLRRVQAHAARLPLPKREAFARHFAVPELVVDMQEHLAFWNIWRRFERALAVSSHTIVDGTTLVPPDCDEYRVLRTTSTNQPASRQPAHVYTKEQFQLMLVFIMLCPDWAARIRDETRSHMGWWVPKPIPTLMKLLGLPSDPTAGDASVRAL
jgi:hypothetical protein